MSLRSLLTRRCDVLRRAAGIGDSGEASGDWQTVAAEVRCRCSMGGSRETLGGDRDRSERDAVFYFEPGVDVVSDDRIVFEDRTYEVIGPSGKVSGRRAAHHLSVAATLVE